MTEKEKAAAGYLYNANYDEANFWFYGRTGYGQYAVLV